MTSYRQGGDSVEATGRLPANREGGAFAPCSRDRTKRRCPCGVAATVTEAISAPTSSIATIVWLFLWASGPNVTIMEPDSLLFEGS